MAKVTGLSGNEIYCLALKQYAAGEIVVGNSVNSMGFLGGIGAGLNNLIGGEISQVTAAIHEGRLHGDRDCGGEAGGDGSGLGGVAGAGDRAGSGYVDRWGFRVLAGSGGGLLDR